MTEHDEVRELLPLVASGDVTAEELRQVQEHLLQCGRCRQAREELEALAASLRSVPTPQPRPELVRGVLRLAEAKLSTQERRGGASWFLAPLIASSWVLAFLTWPLAVDLGRWLIPGLRFPDQSFENLLAAYSLLGLLLASIAAIAVVRHAGAPWRAK